MEILQGGINVAVQAEVWHEVVSWWSVWRVLWIPEVAKLLLGNLDAVGGVKHFVVGTEVWNEVVSWWISWWWCWIPRMTELTLGQSGALLRCGDIVVLAEVWHEIVTRVWISHWMSNDIVGHFFSDNFLSVNKRNFNILHIGISTKMWDKVILWRSTVSWRW